MTGSRTCHEQLEKSIGDPSKADKSDNPKQPRHELNNDHFIFLQGGVNNIKLLIWRQIENKDNNLPLETVAMAAVGSQSKRADLGVGW